MAEYIDRTEIFKGCSFIIPEKADAALTVQKLLEHINSIPAADVVEVKHGKWITHRDDADCEYIECSVCGEEFYPPDNAWNFDVTPKYCQECGTKMDNEKE